MRKERFSQKNYRSVTITIDTNIIVIYCSEYTNIEVAHFISSRLLYRYIPKNSQPIFKIVAKITKGIPNDVNMNGIGNKTIIQARVCFLVVSNPLTTGSIGTPAALYSLALLIARA